MNLNEALAQLITEKHTACLRRGFTIWPSLAFDRCLL